MRCPNCGAETSTNVCEYCGSSVEKPAQEHSTAPKGAVPPMPPPFIQIPPTPKKPAVPKGCLLAFVIVFILFIVVGNINSNISNNPAKETNNTASETNNPTKETNNISSDAISISSSPSSSTPMENQTFGLNETAVFKDLKITATELKESSGKKYFEPAAGNVFVGVNFTIENTSDKDQIISSYMLFDAYINDVKCEHSSKSIVNFPAGTLDGTLSSGKKLVGWYSVEVPKDWKKLEFQVKSSWASSSKATFVFNKK